MSSSLLSAAGEGISGIFLPQHPLQGLRLMLLVQLARPLGMCDYCQMMLNVGHWFLGLGIGAGLFRVDEVPGCSSILAQKKVGFSDPGSEERDAAEGGSVVSSATTMPISKGFGGSSDVLSGGQRRALGWNSTERVGTEIARHGHVVVWPKVQCEVLCCYL